LPAAAQMSSDLADPPIHPLSTSFSVLACLKDHRLTPLCHYNALLEMILIIELYVAMGTLYICLLWACK